MYNSLEHPNWLEIKDVESTAERQLLIGVIDRSVRDAVERFCELEESLDAVAWFEGTHKDETLYRFVDVCAYLDIDPELFLAEIRPLYADLLS